MPFRRRRLWDSWPTEAAPGGAPPDNSDECFRRVRDGWLLEVCIGESPMVLLWSWVCTGNLGCWPLAPLKDVSRSPLADVLGFVAGARGCCCCWFRTDGTCACWSACGHWVCSGSRGSWGWGWLWCSCWMKLRRFSSRRCFSLCTSSEVNSTVEVLPPKNFSQPGAPLAAKVAGESLLGVLAGFLLQASELLVGASSGKAEDDDEEDLVRLGVVQRLGEDVRRRYCPSHPVCESFCCCWLESSLSRILQTRQNKFFKLKIDKFYSVATKGLYIICQGHLMIRLLINVVLV